MDIHKNARLTLISREELAKRVSQQGWTLKAAAAAFNVSAKTAAKWVGRYRELGREGLGGPLVATAALAVPHRRRSGGTGRSEERRVGKECRSRWSPYH